MAKLNFTVDPNAPKLKPAFSLIERDDYPMVVVSSELRELKSGPAIVMQMKITRGKFMNRRVFKNFLVRHPDPATQARGISELNDLCLAVGITGDLNDTADLHDKEFIGRVYVSEAKDGYDAKNAVRSFRPMTIGTSVDMLREKQIADAAAVESVFPEEEPAEAPKSATQTAREKFNALQAKWKSGTNDSPSF